MYLRISWIINQPPYWNIPSLICLKRIFKSWDLSSCTVLGIKKNKIKGDMKYSAYEIHFLSKKPLVLFAHSQPSYSFCLLLRSSRGEEQQRAFQKHTVLSTHNTCLSEVELLDTRKTLVSLFSSDRHSRRKEKNTISKLIWGAFGTPEKEAWV